MPHQHPVPDDLAPVCAPGCPGHPDALAKVRDELPDEETLYDLAELFRIFGDTTRIKILYALFESELCVGDMAQALGMTQSAVSHQLRVLKSSKLVKFRREGKTVFYSLDDDHVRSILSLGMEHVEE
ncbi:MAG TPA: metalloregulator ArsR/SmtB family transcription factor [Candidatus Gemmiger avicola]|uniref:Metalloregulator ArsR/SmtB family transcription factor n=1 Tax=Candidatus Gemmiger avicola TaxID=2838605 RepID=A0A9D2M7A0_9FIRM|nr:metalloregulator ArsR/SmtB family transcription factor [Candidatus Gemmiger avicola]